jgi:hypothetical protein
VVTERLLGFLGAAPVPGITAACFDAPHEGDGPGDEKIWFTTRVSNEAIGRGVRVPAAARPPEVRDQVNDALVRLGYRTVADDWNTLPVPLDPRQPGAGVASAAAAAPVPAARVLTPVVRTLRERIESRAGAEPDLPLRRWPALAGQVIRFVVTDDGRQAELSWTFPAGPANGPAGPANGLANGAGPAGRAPLVTMFADPRVWQALLDGDANMITEIRSGRLRCVNKRDAHRVRSDEVHAIAWLLGLAQVPLARSPARPPM